MLYCIHYFVDLFHDVYGFGTGNGGLVYLGLGVGFLVSTYFGASTADSIYKKVRQSLV